MNCLDYRRMVILTDGQLSSLGAKTASSLIRYRREHVVAVLDPQHVGQPLEGLIGWGQGIPVIASIEQALAFEPDSLLIGIAPIGGKLPDAWRTHLTAAIRHGMSIVSGLHMLLRDDDELSEQARKHGVELLDVRDPGPFDRVAVGMAAELPVKRVLTVGTDCAVGKMVATLELRAAARRVGWDAAFVATGQTGIMIEGWGIAVDRVISDFTAGAAEWLCEQVADRQIAFIEGQGSITHPGYSGVSLGLLHGACPDALIVCHQPGRDHHHGVEKRSASLLDHIALNERLANARHPCRVCGVSLYTAGMSDEDARAAIKATAAETGLPTTDVVRFGCDPLIESLREAFELP
ncbi:MAG: DUF1611 domain-containing protein [Phycisphaerae bacterium]|nr:DUF1611 domain-containing protein [Phycisphaerae bacterium]